ncbi:BON domain-containing protein [Aporhodopirellula aestuarii]|uniref:BON domain-containing protein n=1 Tax=Aporhodopirellula aestuarii TaxID=2950107 RepID=A0ABT0TWR2_9BACT|nr:BON domain-containing protein [Aporhodopirellula aestuarii]MCM2369062.1 BON domain-containing protein [Aporhodopirellula aestuarii]
MNRSISTTGIQRAGTLLAMAFLIGFVCTPVSAQQAGGTQDTAQGATQGGTQGGGLTPDQAFSAGVTRTGIVGQATTTPVGASAASSAGGTTGGATGGRSAFGGGFGGGLGAAFGNLFNNNTSSSSSTPAIRTRLRASIEIMPGTLESRMPRQAVAENRFRSAGTLQPRGVIESTSFSGANTGTSPNAFSGVNVQISGDTAVLQGTVADESDRRMSELLMRLEPGVSKVQNRIGVAP